MGNNQSHQLSAPVAQTTFSEKVTNVADAFESVHLDDASQAISEDGSLTQENLKHWESEASKDPRLSLARTILNHNEISSALLSRNASIADTHVFNTQVDFVTGPTTDQKSSGRCWLFASTNVIRYSIMKKLGLKEFELSQSYLFFYDKLEKANYFLEQTIEFAHLPIDDRLISHLSSNPVNDGGQWDMIVNLLSRYGVVPKSLFPESFSSSSSVRLNKLLTTKLREHSLRLRSLLASLSSHPHSVRIAAARKRKEEFMKEVWNILSVALGVPPKADEKFKWEYYDEKGVVRVFEGTPVEFYKANSSKLYPPTNSFSLINDPRNPYSALYTVDRLGNIWGGRAVTYVNTEAKRLKEAVITCIRAGQPVFFGCDVGQFSNTQAGIMDTGLFDYENAFGIKLGLTKSDRLQTGESAMTHAMVINGVHLSPSGDPIRWKVENSWGPNAGEKGYFVMTDEWFSEFVYQVVIPRKLAPKDLVDVLDGGEATVYPPWDPMGTLA